MSLGVSNKMVYTHIKPLIRITVLGFQEMVMYDEGTSVGATDTFLVLRCLNEADYKLHSL